MAANPEHDARVEHIIKQAERELCEAAATITAQAVEIARLRGALSEFLDSARYDPTMSGEGVFKGWQQSQLRRAETLARAALNHEGSNDGRS